MCKHDMPLSPLLFVACKETYFLNGVWTSDNIIYFASKWVGADWSDWSGRFILHEMEKIVSTSGINLDTASIHRVLDQTREGRTSIAHNLHFKSPCDRDLFTLIFGVP